MNTHVAKNLRSAARLSALAARRTARVIAAHPFTSLLMLAMLTVSGLHGTFSGHVGESLSFGLPALRAGHVWNYFLGAMIVPTATLLPVAAVLVAIAVGGLERKVGSLRAAVALVGTHLVGTVGTSLFLWVASTTDWPWADGLAGLSDTGLSAGTLGVLAILTVFMRPPVRRVVRAGVGLYLVVMLLRSGLLWDVEHLLAFGMGLVIGPRFAGRRAAPLQWGSAKLSTLRKGAALLLLVTAFSELIQVGFPGYGGPFGPGPVDDASAPALATALGLLAIALPVADGLRRGSRLAWRAMTLTAGMLFVAHAVHAITLAASDVLVVFALLALAVSNLEVVLSYRAAALPVSDIERRIAEHGAGSLGWQNTWAGSETWATADGDVLITYRSSWGVAIVVGEPVGPTDRWVDAVQEFTRFCEREGLTPAWYAVGDEFVPAAREHGWSALQIGEDTVLSLPGLEFRGRSWQDVRTARNRAAKEGIVLESVSLRDAPQTLLAQVQEISDAWVDEKPLPEMGFTLGGVTEALDPQVRTHVAVDPEGRVHGVTTWMPVHQDGRIVGWTLDLMRRRSDGFRPVMEFLIAESAMLFKAEGYDTLSLSVAPLARRTQGSQGLLDKTLDKASLVLEPTYGFRSLLGFKAKFDPSFRPVHLAYASGMDLPLISLAIAHAYLPTMTMSQLGHLVGEVSRPLRARVGLTAESRLLYRGRAPEARPQLGSVVAA